MGRAAGAQSVPGDANAPADRPSEKDLQIQAFSRAAEGIRTLDLLHGKQNMLSPLGPEIPCKHTGSRAGGVFCHSPAFTARSRGFGHPMGTQLLGSCPAVVRSPRLDDPSTAIAFCATDEPGHDAGEHRRQSAPAGTHGRGRLPDGPRMRPRRRLWAGSRLGASRSTRPWFTEGRGDLEAVELLGYDQRGRQAVELCPMLLDHRDRVAVGVRDHPLDLLVDHPAGLLRKPHGPPGDVGDQLAGARREAKLRDWRRASKFACSRSFAAPRTHGRRRRARPPALPAAP
jgi:hypothetical protein